MTWVHGDCWTPQSILVRHFVGAFLYPPKRVTLDEKKCMKITFEKTFSIILRMSVSQRLRPQKCLWQQLSQMVVAIWVLQQEKNWKLTGLLLSGTAIQSNRSKQYDWSGTQKTSPTRWRVLFFGNDKKIWPWLNIQGNYKLFQVPNQAPSQLKGLFFYVSLMCAPSFVLISSILHLVSLTKDM